MAAYAALSGSLAIAVVRLVSGHTPPEPAVAVAFLAFQSVTVLTVALTLGTRLPSIAAGAVTVVLFGLGWFAGVLGNVAVAFGAAPLAGVGDAARILLPSDGLWRGVIYGLEPPVVLFVAAGRSATAMQANPFFASAPPPLAFIAWSAAWVRARPRRRHRPVPPARALTAAAPYGSGRASNRLLRSGSVPDGRAALYTLRKTSAETVFVAVVP